MYSEKVMQHFKNPHNLGEIKNPDGIGKIGNPTCLPQNTIVHANDSLVEINGIGKNSLVLGNDGFYNKVLRTIKRRYYSVRD